jgi:hypothetical protein
MLLGIDMMVTVLRPMGLGQCQWRVQIEVGTEWEGLKLDFSI